MRLSILMLGLLWAFGAEATEAKETTEAAVQGAVSGGGGKSAVCRDASGAVKSVELLDLWEARTLYNESVSPLSGDLATDVDALLVKMKNAYPFVGSGWLGTPEQQYRDQDYVLAWLRRSAAQFLSNDPRVHRLRGSKLEDTADAMELAEPQDCAIEQVVNYQPNGFIFVNQDLFEKMNEPNQAALLAHEALYDFLRVHANETNSIRVRRTVGLAMSGRGFTVDLFVPPAGALACVSDGGMPRRAKDIIYLTPGVEEGNSLTFQIVPQVLGNSTLMDNSPGLKSDVIMPKAIGREILSGQCVDSFEIATGSTGSGKVEFDRNVEIHWFCDKGKFSMFLYDTKPGMGQPEMSELTCSPADSAKL